MIKTVFLQNSAFASPFLIMSNELERKAMALLSQIHLSVISLSPPLSPEVFTIFLHRMSLHFIIKCYVGSFIFILLGSRQQFSVKRFMLLFASEKVPSLIPLIITLLFSLVLCGCFLNRTPIRQVSWMDHVHISLSFFLFLLFGLTEF